MPKKLTVTLSDKAEKYFNEIAYSLTGKDDKPATQSECINESLETLYDFENKTDNQLRNWLMDYDKLQGEQKSFAANPVPTQPKSIPEDVKNFLNKVMELIDRYTKQIGETGVGNHVKNEIIEYLAKNNSLD